MRTSMLFIVASVLFVGIVSAQQTNPVAVPATGVSYKVGNGPSQFGLVILGKAHWCPIQGTGWNGKNTQNGSKEIGHLVINRNFSVTLDAPAGQVVTADMVNAHWDGVYAGKGATRIGGPSWDSNCHGHSTGRNFWIENTCSCKGMDVLLGNDWKSITSMFELDNCPHSRIHMETADHSVRILDVTVTAEGTIVVIQTSEKMGYAGTYLATYVLPKHAGIGTANTYIPQ